jgi:hypothetical protein
LTVHIFIDESGTFTGSPSHPSLSLVGALVIPDARLARVETKYRALRADLPKDRGEVKGRLLVEHDVDSVVSLLKRNDVLLEITAVDLGMHSAATIAAHQKKQAELITARITEKYHPNLRAQMFDLRRRLEGMTPQLYVQSVVIFELIAKVIELSTLFYCQRIPKELGAFHWVIDGKGKGLITDWESWWSLVVMPALQSRSFEKPMAMFEGGDYSHFDRRFRMGIPEYLKAHIPPNPRRRGSDEGNDLRKMITESFRFSSDPEPGLEMADIVVNATRRAMTGRLGINGWQNIPRLMIHKPQHYIEFAALTRAPHRYEGGAPYMPVLKHFSRGGRNMLAPRYSN